MARDNFACKKSPAYDSFCARAKIIQTALQALRSMTQEPDTTPIDAPSERRWIDVKNTYDAEAWIDSYNRDLQRQVTKLSATGYGICFCLVHGGEIFMHTTSEGAVLLDVTPEAEWAVPVITAATNVPAPHSQIWQLPGETLTQLVLGLNSLIASTRTVLSHDFRIRKY
jgi:hypothetical protein